MEWGRIILISKTILDIKLLENWCIIRHLLNDHKAIAKVLSKVLCYYLQIINDKVYERLNQNGNIHRLCLVT